MRIGFVGVVAALWLGGFALAVAQGPEYVRSEAMVPMRDGVKLHVAIVRPKGSESGEALPFLMERTPYGVDGDDAGAGGVGQAGAGEERIHFCLLRYSRAVWERRAVCDESSDRRA